MNGVTIRFPKLFVDPPEPEIDDDGFLVVTLPWPERDEPIARSAVHPPQAIARDAPTRGESQP